MGDRITRGKADRWTIGAVFAMACVYLVSLIWIGLKPESPLEGFPYATKWGPLCYSVEILIAAIALRWNARRVKACAFAKIMSSTYIALYVVSILYILFFYNHWLFISILCWILCVGCILMGLTYFARLWLKKFGITSSQ